MPIERLASYAVETSWDNSGDYDGEYDNVLADVDGDVGLTITRGRDQARGRGQGRVAASSHTLRNSHRRYSAEYPGSPLNGNLLPGRPHRIRATYGADVAMDAADVRMDDADALMDGRGAVALFTGTLDEVEQRPNLGDRRVGVNALGSLLKLRGNRISTALYESITTGEAVQHAFDAAGLDASEYDIDDDMVSSGRELMWWYADDEDLYDVITKLVLDTEGYPAAVYERADGTIAIEGRNYRTLNTRSTSIQATFHDIVTGGLPVSMDDSAIPMEDSRTFMNGGGSGLFHTGLTYAPGIRDVINAASVQVVTRTAQSSGVVWTYGQTVTLDDDGAATVLAKPTDPFKSAVVPSIGGGDFSLSSGVVTVALSRTSGGSTEIQFTGGSGGATVSNLRLRAVALTTTSTSRVPNQIDMTASLLKYGTRSAQLAAYPGLTVLEAASLADGIVLAYGDPRPLIQFTVVNADGAHLRQQSTRDISDRVHAVEHHTGVALDLMIEQISHTVKTGRIQTTTFSCEKVVEQNWALYDVSLYGTGLYGQ